MVLVWFRKGDDVTLLSPGSGISRATAYRYRDEGVAVLAAQATDLHTALRRVAAEGWSHVILDGKLFDCDGMTAALNWAASELDLPALADVCYDGTGPGIKTPVKQPSDGKRLAIANRTVNRLLRGLRWQGERGFAILIGRWKTLRHTTASPRRTSDIVAAAVHLTHFEYKYLPQSR